MSKPTMSAPLRPKRSLSEPAASTSAANAKLNASTIHSRSRLVASSSRVRVGSETFTIIVATLIVNAARQRTARTARLVDGIT
jgi:hypothetical protein